MAPMLGIAYDYPSEKKKNKTKTKKIIIISPAPWISSLTV